MNAQGTLGNKTTSANQMLVASEGPQASNWELALLVTLMILAYPTYYIVRGSRYVGKEFRHAEKKKLVFMALTSVAVFILVFAASVLIGGIARALQTADYTDIVAPPLELEDRPVAASGSTYGLLPVSVGEFSRDVASDTAGEVLQRLGIASKDTISTEYRLPSGESVTVNAEEMLSPDEASFVMRKLREYASMKGSVGNFSVGLGDVSYMYYRIGNVNSLSWTHGPWLYTVSGASLRIVNKFTEIFPY